MLLYRYKKSANKNHYSSILSIERLLQIHRQGTIKIDINEFLYWLKKYDRDKYIHTRKEYKIISYILFP
jgi:hypothetical protein